MKLLIYILAIFKFFAFSIGLVLLFIGIVIAFITEGPKNIPLINDDNLNYKYDDSKSENGISKI